MLVVLIPAFTTTGWLTEGTTIRSPQAEGERLIPRSKQQELLV